MAVLDSETIGERTLLSNVAKTLDAFLNGRYIGSTMLVSSFMWSCTETEDNKASSKIYAGGRLDST